MDYTKLLQANAEIKQRVSINDILAKSTKVLVPTQIPCPYCHKVPYNKCSQCVNFVEYYVEDDMVKARDCRCIEYCVRCQSTKLLTIKVSVETNIPTLHPFAITHNDIKYAVYLDAHRPYYVSDGKLHYNIELCLSEIVCGFRRKLEHPNHPNTVIVWPRGTLFHHTNKYILPNSGFNGEPLYLTFSVRYPDDIGQVNAKEPFSWRNVERLLGIIPYQQISGKDIVLIDLNQLDFV